MSKISIEDVESALLKRQLDPVKVREIVNDLKVVIEENKVEPTPKTKWEHVILLHDPNQELTGKVFQGWVVQQQEGANTADILSKLTKAMSVANSYAKRPKDAISSAFELFSRLKAKYLNGDVKIKTKEPVQVIFVTQK